VPDLRLGRGIALNADYVGGGTFALLAKKGAGKTYTARVIAEELWDASVQFVVLDPMGAFWGLRSSADGKGEGIPVAIFGGEHGDAPLERTGGTLLADLFVDEGLSMVLDMSGLGSRAAERQFGLDFLDRLYRRNKTSGRLVHVLMDEADLFAPQKPQPGDQPLLGITENIVRRGRNNGIGITLVSQRSAVLNKDVLSQADGMLAGRVLSPQDREAIDAWTKVNGDADLAAEVRESLHDLDTGEWWVWVPELKVLKRARIRESRTFDSSPTRKSGKSGRAEPKSFADVDLAAIEAAMADTIEKAKAEDPKALRARIRELEATAAKVPSGDDFAAEFEKGWKAGQADITPEREIVWPFSDDEFDRAIGEAEDALSHADQAAGALEPIRELVIDARTNATNLLDTLRAWGELRDRAGDSLDKLLAIGAGNLASHGRPPAPQTSVPRPRPAPVRAAAAPRSSAAAPAPPGSNGDGPAFQGRGAGDLPAARQRILDTLAWFDRVGIAAPKRAALAPMAGTKSTSGGFKNNLGALRSAGLVDYPGPNRVALTPDGVAVAREPDIAATPEALQDAVLRSLPSARQAILGTLLQTYPHPVDREVLAETVGVSSTSGGFKNNLGVLRTLELIDYPKPGLVVALPVLFLET
jgi:hypothetical protein